MTVSIIVPIYNAEKYLQRCLNSVLKQTYQDYELILINDGSTDSSGIICDRYKNESDKIVVVHKQNKGSASARNIGLGLARGKYISFIDADDYVSEYFLEKMVELMEKNHVYMVQCKYLSGNRADAEFNIDACDYKVVTNIQMLERLCQKDTYLETAVLWNKLYKRELFEGNSFVEEKGIDDEYLIHRLIYNANVIAISDIKLYYYFFSENSQMSNLRKKPSLKQIDGMKAIEEQLEFFDKRNLYHVYNSLLYRYYSSVASNYFLVKRYFPERKKLKKELNMKRKKYIKVLWIKEISIKDKMLLIARNIAPRLFEYIHARWKNK